MSSDLKIEDLSSVDVAQAEAFLADWLAADFPNLDLTTGRVLRDLLIRPAATFHVLNRTDFDRLRKSMSLKAIEADPTLADEEVVDGVLSNFLVTRDQGDKATGQVTIVIQNSLTTPVDAGTIFSVGETKFVTPRTFVGVTSQAAVLDPSVHRLITARADDTFSFIVDVEAVEVGGDEVRRNTQMDASPAPVGLILAFAVQDFTLGRPIETNSELIARFKQGIAPKVFAGRTQIEAVLRETLPAITAVSIIGAGDAEMVRDRHGVFPISLLGKSDLYVRTQALPQQVKLTKTGVVIDAGAGLRQFTIARDDAPGFYTVDAIILSDSGQSGSLEISEDIRGNDLTSVDGEFVPDIQTVPEGAYTRYQTAVVKFIDPNPGLEDKTYDVYVTAMPGIKTLQDLSSNRARRNPNGDFLVRAPVPAFCSLTIAVEYNNRVPAPAIDAIQFAVADRVNDLNFSLGRLPESVILDAVHDAIGKDGVSVVSPIDLACRIRTPAGEAINLRTPTDLEIPDRPADMVTPRTVIFYLSPQNIAVELRKVQALPV